MNLPKEGVGGLPVAPPLPVAGALEGDVCWHRAGNGERKEGGFRMDLCKRRCLRCERSVVRSGKSLSHTAAVSLSAELCKESIMPSCCKETGEMFSFRTTCWYI